SRKLFLFDSSDIQRLVWRQIAGARLDNLLIPRRECARRLTESERMVFERYLSSDFRTSLREDLKNSLHDLEEGKMSLRAQVDAILICKITGNYSSPDMLRNLYVPFIKELSLSYETR
ncbi:MAG TPA: hypothetical protein VJ044_20030, partial [Candidatus Hodarchaeales archaeon]|nr:hypothetical protein [Candidatus Hodarchaeales archaeon]